MDFPSDATFAWLQLLFAAMWPGLLSLAVYRARVPGPSLEWKDSFVVAAFFTTINYLLLLPLSLYVARGPGTAPGVLYWLSAAVVLVIGPVALPLLWSWLRTTRWLNQFVVAQYATAWDHYFVRRKPVFVLVHLRDGSLLGGYWGPGAYASLSPNVGDLYLTQVYHVDENGQLGERVANTDGALVQRGEYVYIEFVKDSPGGHHGA